MSFTTEPDADPVDLADPATPSPGAVSGPVRRYAHVPWNAGEEQSLEAEAHAYEGTLSANSLLTPAATTAGAAATVTTQAATPPAETGPLAPAAAAATAATQAATPPSETGPLAPTAGAASAVAATQAETPPLETSPLAPAAGAAAADVATSLQTSPPVTPAATPAACGSSDLCQAVHMMTEKVSELVEQVVETEDPKEGKRQGRATYMRYYRSLRSVNCPAAIRKKFDEANTCEPHECQQKLTALFEEFKRCNEDWATSSIVLEESRSHATSHNGIWKWVTREEPCQQICFEVHSKYYMHISN